ncbi:MAG: hypothetical protein KZQ96_22300 [Candidatus Thiodiazotropha sp. (ex Lucinoma borealis)]|nr:hypothetical protein [Candidatus Thiodiazotropha sp. (ex Lucinoma borealis)]MCU7868240.1 hypothetical protein [Candidatus Thiodiazotropha sp. (ex Lucinoma borealis)]
MSNSIFAARKLKNEQLLHILAGDLYRHLETYGKQTGCCIPQLGIYCPVGQNLKLGYITSVQMAQNHDH